MRATELFVGAWVYALGRNRKVKSIVSKDTGIEVSFDGKNPVIVSPDEILPILITTEILEENGWENVSDEDCKIMQINNGSDAFWWSSKAGTCGCEGVEDKNGEENLVERFACENMWFIHKLQFALQLCEIEKKIEI